MNKAFFITGTDTGCGKTQVSVALMKYFKKQGFSVSAMKPLASGCEKTSKGLRNEDALALLTNSDGDWKYEDINPYAFEPPIAPHIAADWAEVKIDLNSIQDCLKMHQSKSDVVIVEGVGGWCVPVDIQTSLADMTKQLNLSVILVVGLRLGCINHALLSDRAICTDNTEYIGWVSNMVEENYMTQDETLRSLNTLMSSKYLGHLPNIKAKQQEFDPSQQFLTMINTVK